MGQSTDGILFYGVAFGEDAPEALQGEENFARYLAGVTDKTADIPYREQDRLLKESGVEIVRYCSGDYPMYGLAVAGAIHQVARGYAVELGQKIEAPKSEALREVLKKFNVTTEPQWVLVSDWS